MSQYRRAFMPGGTFFFTVNTHHRQQILTRDNIRQTLRNAIQKTRANLPFEIIAWVLLPDHLHCIWTLPDGDTDYSKRWSMIKRRVSQQCGTTSISPSRSKRNESDLWQRRFWEHQIRDNDDMNRHIDYIHWNPMKHQLVKKVSDWPHSTFHRFVAEGIYPPDWCSASQTDNNPDQYGE